MRRRRLRAVIFARQLIEAEFTVADRFPQKIRVELAGEFVRVADRLRSARLGEAQQNIRRLDLEPLAGDGLDLQRLVVIGQDGAGLQLAVVLEENVHGKDLRTALQRAAIIPVQ